MILRVPALVESEGYWPTLGPQVCDWIETFCVHGPGDVLGQDATLTDEQRAIVYALYELYPRDHARAGRRRITRAALSVRRGWAKTELGAWVACGELHDDGPVRFGGWDANGDPVGVPLTSPLLLLFSATEEQADDTAFAAMKAVVENGPLADELYAVGEHISRLDGAGKAKTLAASPSSNEGRLATFGWFEETHRATRPGVKAAHRVVRDGFPKRMVGDPWSLETTTAFVPGEDSIAEATYLYAEKVARGEMRNNSLFFYHRQASDHHDLKTREGRDAAIREATGPSALPYTDVERINDQWDEDDADPQRLEQVWLNRPVKSSGQAFDIGRWDEFAADQAVIPEAGRLIALGFDGSRTEDTTGIVGTDIETGYQWVVGFWDPNDRDQCPDGEVPVADVVETFHQTFETWTVVRLHAEPYHWRETIDNLAGIYGRDVVVARWSTQIRRSAFAIDAYIKAIMNGDVMHSGDQRMRAHLANAHKRSVEVKNPKTGRRMFLLCKDRDDSPRKIDLADAGWLSWEGAGVAIADGALTEGTYEAWAA